VERPRIGDETRTWGPPFVKDAQGTDTTESAYYLPCNRNKRSVAIDMATPEGAALIRRLASQSDVLIENFKVGGLSRFGLSYDDLKDELPRLVYCSITGFGQTGPYADRPGYDLVVQGMGGRISMSGEPGRPPAKVRSTTS
jgi:crotonobetainyl-CoA:carnitine CoA-transferase CaiB-like acyl-CoA transferase